MKPLAEGGTGEGVGEGGEVKKAAELGGTDGAAAEGEVIGGEAEYSNENEEDVLARGSAVGAGAGGEGGEGDGVDISGGAKNEEGGVGAVEEEERVAESAEDAIGDGLGVGEGRRGGCRIHVKEKVRGKWICNGEWMRKIEGDVKGRRRGRESIALLTLSSLATPRFPCPVRPLPTRIRIVPLT